MTQESQIKKLERWSWSDEERDLEKAVALSTRLMKEHPRLETVYRVHRTHAQIGLGDIKAARQDFKACWKSMKTTPVWVLAARYYHATERPEQASKSLQRAIDLTTTPSFEHGRLVNLLASVQAGVVTDIDFNIATPRRDFTRDLPLEVFTSIIALLNQQSRCRASAVCRAWRRSILGTPGLWRNLNLEKLHRISYTNLLKTITKISSYAGGNLLHVHLHRQDTGGIIPILDQLGVLAQHSLCTLRLTYEMTNFSRYFARQMLHDLRLSERFPLLRIVRCRSTTEGKPLRTPNLMTMNPQSAADILCQLQRFDSDDPDALASLPTSLPDLGDLRASVSPASQEHVFELLQGSPRLKHLDLLWLPSTSQAARMAVPECIAWRRLRSLHLDCRDDAFRKFTREVQLPRVTDLSVTCSAQMLHIFDAPRVKTFTFTSSVNPNTVSDSRRFYEWIEENPTISTLKIKASGYIREDLSKLVVSQTEPGQTASNPPPVLLPDLQGLEVGFIDEAPDGKTIFNIVRSRQAGSEGILWTYPRRFQSISNTPTISSPFTRGLGAHLPATSAQTSPPTKDKDGEDGGEDESEDESEAETVAPLCEALTHLHFGFPADSFSSEIESALRKLVSDVTFLPKPKQTSYYSGYY